MAFLDQITWAMVLLVAGLLTVIVVQANAGLRGGTRKTWTWVGIGGLAVGFIAMSGFIPQLDFLMNPIGFGGEETTQPTSVVSVVQTQQTPSGICAVEDTTVTLSASNKYTSVATGGTHRYRVNGAPALAVSDAGTFTASPGDILDLLFLNGTSGTYFGVKAKETVPCLGTKTFSAEAYQNGTLTFEVFNEEGNLLNTAGENETLAAGDVVTLESKLKGQYERGFPHGLVVVVEFNGSAANPEIDDVIVDFGGSEVSIPAVHATTLGSSSKRKAYSIPPILSNDILVGKVLIDSDDTNNPGDLQGDIVIDFYTKDYYVNSKTGGSYEGPDTDDEFDAATFGRALTQTLHID